MKARFKALARDLVAATLYKTGATRPTDAARLTIVTFHRVLTPEQLAEYPISSIAVTPDELGWFLQFFGEYFECGALDRLHERWARGESFSRPPLAITFDDGQRDNFENAKPVLDRAGLRATFFVPTQAAETGELLWHDRAAYAASSWLRRDASAALAAAQRLGVPSDVALHELPASAVEALKRLPSEERERWISQAHEQCGGQTVPSWDGLMSFHELATLQREEHEIGSHSHSHPILTLLDDAALLHELSHSRAVLEQRLGRAVTSFCYPNGSADERVIRAAEAAGYQRAVTTRFGLNGFGTNPFRMSRCDMQAQTARSAGGALSTSRLAWRMSGLYPGLG
ncbi:MAG TPA: polysaccharide deacetylase family protein [Polyangiaceae bacterium]|nr:polysaccharide deacetylase family protein [Polyangiaceae bacterium]